ncbi:hypothetical protein CPC08DRAFT_712666 [Agrocybe pediades]|nr:hypothetical protein CPC08DRAFT_712666 [Agrocybe pediades]
MIIFYDIITALPNQTLSPNSWKTRFTLNFKGIPYRTEWLEIDHIQERLKADGFNPTGKKDDGSDFYTLPAIHDTSAGTKVADSFLIAQYLDKTYPDTPKIFPHLTTGLQSAFEDQFMTSLTSMWPFSFLPVHSKLTPRGQAHNRKSKQEQFGKPLESLELTGEEAVREWENFRNAIGKIDEYYAKTGGTDSFLLGDSISWGDIVVASFFNYLKLAFGDDSERWKDISKWHAGRWNRLLIAFDRYTSVL